MSHNPIFQTIGAANVNFFVRAF